MRVQLPLLSLTLRTPSRQLLSMQTNAMSGGSLSTRTIQDLSSGAQPQIANLLCKSFPMSDPYSWGRPLGYTDEGFRSYIEPYTQEYFKKDHHRVIGFKNCESDELDAVLLYEPFGKVEIDRDKVTYDRNGPIESLMFSCRFQFIDNLLAASPSLSSEEASRLNCGYIAWMAVDPSLRRNGLCLALVQEATRRMQMGYDCIIAYCTSPKSRNVFLKAGYEVWGEIKYSTFEVNGSCPYESLPDEVSIMVKRTQP